MCWPQFLQQYFVSFPVAVCSSSSNLISLASFVVLDSS